MSETYRAWGRLGPGTQRAIRLADPPGASFPEGSVLPFGNGRSYGDVCLNTPGTLLDTRAMNRILHFDPDSGLITCQAGALLSDILDLTAPVGWFLPVTPGTKFVTVGGAIANDVHGKNHHRAGTFGRHVARLHLLRSDGGLITCAPDDNPEWFRATIGGLGLTGLVVQCDLQLVRIPSRSIAVRTTRFGNLAEFFALSAESDRTFEYTVSWIDCLARGKAQGRGWFLAGNHIAGPVQPPPSRRSLRFFLEPPVSFVNAVTLRAFNWLYYHRPVPAAAIVDYDPFFYPLDAILDWNRMYGPRGFYQFQCVVPRRNGEPAIREVLSEVARSGEGSFLAVLKQFGDQPSPGLLSFPRPGPTLALDFPNRGERTVRLLRRLEDIVMAADGALYPAKDSCMSPASFHRSYPDWPILDQYRDPAFSSDFWRRVTTSE